MATGAVFNQKSLYNGYKKRTKNIEVNLEEYNKLKAEDPEFYREASSLQYGKVCIAVLQLWWSSMIKESFYSLL